MLRILVQGRLSPDLNMAIDEVLLRGTGSDYAYTLRFYGWQRPTVSLGYTQPWEQGFDPEIAAREHIDLVRRRTGGRAVLHADEITYSIAGPTEWGPFAAGVQGTYRAVTEGLANGLRTLGAPVELVRSRGRRERQEPGACFATRALHEIVADGKKLLGSAQRRQRKRALQHGSLLLAAPQQRLWRVLGPTADTARQASVGLEGLLGVAVGRRALSAVLGNAVAASLELQPVHRKLSRAEQIIARRLARRYRDPGFTCRR